MKGTIYFKPEMDREPLDIEIFYEPQEIATMLSVKSKTHGHLFIPVSSICYLKITQW